MPGGFKRAATVGAKKTDRHHHWCAPSSMRRGDILLFNVKTIHAATVQKNDRTRLSLDTRITSYPKRATEQRHDR